MGTVGREIVGLDVDELIEDLNKALADEWLAYYQYWVGSKVVEGPMRLQVEAELIEHAGEELGHANMLAERIVTLGGAPILDFSQLMKLSGCGYDAPKDSKVKAVLKQNIKGEQCAIKTYHRLLKKLSPGSDPITFNLIRKIMEDEVEHEHDLEDILNDIHGV